MLKYVYFVYTTFPSNFEGDKLWAKICASNGSLLQRCQFCQSLEFQEDLTNNSAMADAQFLKTSGTVYQKAKIEIFKRPFSVKSWTL